MFFFCSISNWYKLNFFGAMLGQSTTLFLNHDSGCILLEQYGTQFSLNFNYHYLFQFFKAKCRQLMYSISNQSIQQAIVCLQLVPQLISFSCLYNCWRTNKTVCKQYHLLPFYILFDHWNPISPTSLVCFSLNQLF